MKSKTNEIDEIKEAFKGNVKDFEFSFSSEARRQYFEQSFDDVFLLAEKYFGEMTPLMVRAVRELMYVSFMSGVKFCEHWDSETY